MASLTFGFWSSLTVGERTATIWNPMLNRALPKGTSRATVHDLVQRVVKFRNRLAHNEPVFSTRTGLDSRLAEVTTLFKLLDPVAYPFVVANSQLGDVLAACPIPGLTTATGLS